MASSTSQRFLPRPGTHCLGNGSVAAYVRGADIWQLFGPCYGIPSFLSLNLAEPNTTPSVSRLAGTGLWRIDLTVNATPAGHLLDAVHPTRPHFLRTLHLPQPLRFTLETHAEVARNVYGTPNSILLKLPAGTPIFADCKLDFAPYAQLLFSPNVTLGPSPSDILFPAGESWVAFVAGRTLADCCHEAEHALHITPKSIQDASIGTWRKTLASVRDISPLVLKHPEEQRLRETIEDVAVALLAQTSSDGGVLAGPYFHLGYVRDMYGVLRAYLALGLYEQARGILEFFLRNWRAKGFLPNASGLGIQASHCHECDDVEQTAYALLALREYANTTGEKEYVNSYAEFVAALTEAQDRHVVHGMLPFNGDETYIAGGILPRTCIDHGSMEATALYLASTTGTIFAPAAIFSYAFSDIDRKHHTLRVNASDQFRLNFRSQDGRVRANNPSRLKYLRPHTIPEFRHGVCLQCGAIADLRRTPSYAFLCPKCYGHSDIAPSQDIYHIDAATLMTHFVGSIAIPSDLIYSTATQAWLNRASRPAHTNVVGYEYGLQLYTLADAPKLPSFLPTMLSELLNLRHSGGVWAEYYRNGIASPDNCPYRPWESAINLCGILHYLERINNPLSTGYVGPAKTWK